MTHPTPIVRRLAILLTWLAAAGAVHADILKPEPLSAFPQSMLAIRTAGGSVLNFMVWNANNPSREEQGLMYIRQLDDHAGMLFVFPESQRISMWMKNTYIPLDLVFIDATGRIVHIARNATPLSLEIISAPTPARAVLELKGGIAEQLGIRVGDTVIEQSLHTAH